MQRPARLAALGAAAAAALYLALAASSPVSLGFFGDDAVYATTAKALAEGRGYRHIEIPGEPLQTKYPPLYPAVLSLVLRARPDLPGSFSWLLAPTALAGAGAVALSALYWRRVLGASRRFGIALAVLAALSPVLLAFTRVAMSELLYALFATAALLCLDERASAKGSTLWLLLGALLVGCAVLTRTIGVSLALAAVAALLLRRRTADALLVGAVILACVAPWWSFQSSAAIENGAAGRSFLVAHELGYASWLPSDPLEALRVAGQNLLRLSFGLGYFQLGAAGRPGARGDRTGRRPPAAAPRDLPRDPPLRALGLLAQRAGRRPNPARLRRDLRRDPPALDRLALPLPGAVDAVPAVLRGDGAARRCGLAGSAGVAYATVLALFLAEGWQLARSTERGYFAREATIDWTELRDVERFLREHTRPEEVIASSHPERLFLTTGRRGHYFWPDTDPVAFDYDPGARRAASRSFRSPRKRSARREDVRATSSGCTARRRSRGTWSGRRCPRRRPSARSCGTDRSRSSCATRPPADRSGSTACTSPGRLRPPPARPVPGSRTRTPGRVRAGICR